MTHTAANVEWRQLPGDETTLEVRMPIILAPSTANSDISVTVADSAVVIVKVAGAVIWQCRMYANINDEIDWTLEENKTVLVMEIQKAQGETWPALLNVPLKVDDKLFLTKADLDERIARELPSLPPVEEEAAAIAAAEGKTEEAEEEKKAEEETPAAEEKEDDGEAADKKDEETTEAAATEEETAAPAATEETPAAAEEAEKKDDEEATEATKEDGEKATEEKEEEKAASKPASKAASEAADPTDMLDDDDLLNDALNEVEASTSEKKADGEAVEGKKVEEKSAEEKEKELEETMTKQQIAAELRGIQMETQAITEKLEEMMEELAKAAEGSEEKATLTEHVKIASRMLELVRETRNLRSERATIETFLKVQMADIQKARVNIGETAPYETEEFQDDYEKTLSGLQLFKGALQYLNQDPATAVHLLRLAAIHHNHAPSVVALFSIYTNVPSSYPRGASLMLQNALRGEGHEVEARTNSRVGDLFNSGTRHFPPIFSLAVYFHQRAAMAGNTHSMVSLAQLFLAGECTGDDTMSPSLKRLNKDEKRANYFLQCAVDRGSLVAYLIRAAQYAQGTDGMPKSLEMAKKYYDRAVKAEASLGTSESKLMRIGTRMTVGDLAKLLYPEDSVKVTEKAAPAVTAAKKPTTTAAAPSADDDDIIELRPSSNRNAAPTAAMPVAQRPTSSMYGNAGGMPSGAVAAPAKRNNAFTASSNKRKAQWETAARWGVGIYAVYCLAFPLRIIMLPFFYDKVASFMEMFGLDHAGASSLEAAGMSL